MFEVSSCQLVLPFGEISEDSELNACIHIHTSMTEQT